MLFCFRSAFPDLWVKKALCRWLEEEGLEGHKKYNNTIMVVQEIVCINGKHFEEISGCLYISQALFYKRPETVGPATLCPKKEGGKYCKC